jgi:uncharacterized membrane protein
MFFFLCTMLYTDYRVALAFSAVGLCIIHLIMMNITIRRCGIDINLRISLLVMGLFFLTIAIPLYLKMYAVAIAWAIEALVLLVIGLRYRSIMTQIGALIAIILSVGRLLYHLPMHHGAFDFVMNPPFGTWAMVAAVILTCHILYRRTSALDAKASGIIAQILYTTGILALTAACMMEWIYNYDSNITSAPDAYCIRGLIVLATAFILLLVTEPISPKGLLPKSVALVLTFAGVIFLLICHTETYEDAFTVFANIDFAIAVLFVIGLFASAWLLSRNGKHNKLCNTFAWTGIIILLILLTQQIYMYWYCQNRYGEKIANWSSMANMYISIMWAVYAIVLIVIGFWYNKPALRYISLGLFALLLGKVFILDTSNVKSVYRIAAFLATGLALVGVSYLYQFLRKTGFFEKLPTQKTLDE